MSPVLAALGFPGLASVVCMQRRALPLLGAEEDQARRAICLLNVPRTCSKKLISILAWPLVLPTLEAGEDQVDVAASKTRYLDQKPVSH